MNNYKFVFRLEQLISYIIRYQVHYTLHSTSGITYEWECMNPLKEGIREKNQNGVHGESSRMMLIRQSTYTHYCLTKLEIRLHDKKKKTKRNLSIKGRRQ